MMIEDIANRAYQQFEQTGGATVNLQGIEPTSGYAYGGYVELEKVLPPNAVTPESILQYMQDNEQALAMPNHYLGIWHDQESGNVFLDVSIVSPPGDDALKDAKDRGQIAVWDIGKGVEIPTGGTLDRNITSRVSASSEAHQQALDANRGQNLQGLPGLVNVPGTGRLQFHSHGDIQRVANEYNQANGLGEHPSDYVKVSPQHGARIAQEYEAMQHDPHNPQVAQAYDALAKETRAQYDHAVKNGYQFEFYPESDPYPNSPREAVLDLHHNKHMYVYPTETGYGQGQDPQDHPMLGDSGVRWNSKPVTHNDLFRAVHDFYGHAKEGLGFRADGEDNAYRQHAAMFSDNAKRALASETRGQNSWVNYGPHGEHNQTATHDTIYAPQKAGLMPDWTTDEGLHRTAGWEQAFKQSSVIETGSDRGKVPGLTLNERPFLFTNDHVYLGPPGSEHYDISKHLGLDTSNYVGGEKDGLDDSHYRPGILDEQMGEAYAYPRMHQNMPSTLEPAIAQLSLHLNRDVRHREQTWEDMFRQGEEVDPDMLEDMEGDIDHRAHSYTREAKRLNSTNEGEWQLHKVEGQMSQGQHSGEEPITAHIPSKQVWMGRPGQYHYDLNLGAEGLDFSEANWAWGDPGKGYMHGRRRSDGRVVWYHHHPALNELHRQFGWNNYVPTEAGADDWMGIFDGGDDLTKKAWELPEGYGWLGPQSLEEHELMSQPQIDPYVTCPGCGAYTKMPLGSCPHCGYSDYEKRLGAFNPKGHEPGSAVVLHDGTVRTFSGYLSHNDYLKEQGLTPKDVMDYGMVNSDGTYTSLTGRLPVEPYAFSIPESQKDNWDWYQNDWTDHFAREEKEDDWDLDSQDNGISTEADPTAIEPEIETWEDEGGSVKEAAGPTPPDFRHLTQKFGPEYAGRALLYLNGQLQVGKRGESHEDAFGDAVDDAWDNGDIGVVQMDGTPHWYSQKWKGEGVEPDSSSVMDEWHDKFAVTQLAPNMWPLPQCRRCRGLLSMGMANCPECHGTGYERPDMREVYPPERMPWREKLEIPLRDMRQASFPQWAQFWQASNSSLPSSLPNPSNPSPLLPSLPLPNPQPRPSTQARTYGADTKDVVRGVSLRALLTPQAELAQHLGLDAWDIEGTRDEDKRPSRKEFITSWSIREPIKSATEGWNFFSNNGWENMFRDDTKLEPWKPGKPGKGILTPSGMHSWATSTEGMSGSPHHGEAEVILGMPQSQGNVYFDIYPNGNVMAGYGPIELLDAVTKHDPRLKPQKRDLWENKFSSVWNPPEHVYHVAPTGHREAILTHGLDASRGASPWENSGARHPDTPVGNYFWSDPTHAEEYVHNMKGTQDIWEVPSAPLALEHDWEGTDEVPSYVSSFPIHPQHLKLYDTVEPMDWEERFGASGPGVPREHDVPTITVDGKTYKGDRGEYLHAELAARVGLTPEQLDRASFGEMDIQGNHRLISTPAQTQNRMKIERELWEDHFASRSPDGTDGWFHVAPTTDRARIRTHGLQPASPALNDRWFEPIYDHTTGENSGLEAPYWAIKQPVGVYVEPTPEDAYKRWATDATSGKIEPQKWDVWHIPSEQIKNTAMDRVTGGEVITHPVFPTLYEGPEHRLSSSDEHKLWWKPGTEGRGLISPEGIVHTWPETEMTHAQRLMALRVNHMDQKNWERIGIRPNGSVGVFRPEQGELLQKADPRLRPVISPFVWNKDIQKAEANPNYRKTSVSEDSGVEDWEDHFGKTLSTIRSPHGTDVPVVQVNTPSAMGHEGSTPVIYRHDLGKAWIGSIGSTHAQLIRFVPELTHDPYRGDRPSGVFHGALDENNGTPYWYGQDGTQTWDQAFAKEDVRAKPQKCKECKNPAVKSLVWAEGMAYVPVCADHESYMRKYLKDQDGEGAFQEVEIKQKKESKETPNQEQRRWEGLNVEHPNTAKVVHNLSNGWTVQQLGTRHDVQRTGKMLRNCWAGRFALTPKRYNPDSKYHTLNDERGIPRVAFEKHPYAHEQGGLYGPPYGVEAEPMQGPMLRIGGPLGRNNKRLTPHHANLFREWAQATGLPLAMDWGGQPLHFDHPVVQNAFFSGKGILRPGGIDIGTGERFPDWHQEAQDDGLGELEETDMLGNRFDAKVAQVQEIPPHEEKGWENLTERPYVYDRLTGVIHLGYPGDSHSIILNHLGEETAAMNTPSQWSDRFKDGAINHTTGELSEYNAQLTDGERAHVHNSLQQHLGVTPFEPYGWEDKFSNSATWDDEMTEEEELAYRDIRDPYAHFDYNEPIRKIDLGESYNPHHDPEGATGTTERREWEGWQEPDAPVIFDGKRFYEGPANSYHWDLFKQDPELGQSIDMAEYMKKNPLNATSEMARKGLAYGRFNPAQESVTWYHRGRFHPEKFRSLVNQVYGSPYDESADMGYADADEQWQNLFSKVVSREGVFK